MHRNAFCYILLLTCSLLLTSCGRFITENGKASYYGDEYNGKKTASGETFNKNKLTAAHKTLPFGTVVIVKNMSNGKTVKVTITDRGPYTKGRIIDLSEKAASKIDMINQGVAEVQLKYRKKKK
ncbi:MAG TPA: septal ring lytic transglycosylase RlpA family protein [Chitinophagaceae bacterium]|nr:septal ring lytic transglycosylase RlpA family protein [Chitinophagaceae bacterium]